VHNLEKKRSLVSAVLPMARWWRSNATHIALSAQLRAQDKDFEEEKCSNGETTHTFYSISNDFPQTLQTHISSLTQSKHSNELVLLTESTLSG